MSEIRAEGWTQQHTPKVDLHAICGQLLNNFAATKRLCLCLIHGLEL